MSCTNTKGLRRLSRQSPPTLVYNRARHEHRHRLVLLLEQTLNGEQSRLAVGRVENSLHHEHIAAPVQQTSRLLLIRRHQLVKCHIPELGLLHRRRDRQRFICWANRSDGIAASTCNMQLHV